MTLSRNVRLKRAHPSHNKTPMVDSRIDNEIKHGQFLAGDWGGKVPDWERPAGQRRWKRRAEMLSSLLRPDLAVLEIGCGAGYFTKVLAESGARITAIDISPDLLKVARRAAPSANVTFQLENAYAMSFPDNSFDLVAGISVLHHLDIEKGLAEVFRVLKPGGGIFFTEPNMLNPQIALQKNIPPLKKWAGDSPDETAFFKWGLAARLRRRGFGEVEVEPFDFMHPAIPAALIPSWERICLGLERIPLVREIGGSLRIRARKPA